MLKFIKLFTFALGISITASYKNIHVNESSTSVAAVRRSVSAKSNNFLLGDIVDFAKDLYLPSVIQDLYKFLIKVPPKRLASPRNVKHGTIEDVHKYLSRSLISSCPAEKILNLECLCEKTFSNIKIIKDEDSRSLVTVTTDDKYNLIIVSYRASLSAQNWLTNFEYPMIDFPNSKPGVKVHHGFYSNHRSSYVPVKNAVVELLDNPKYKNYILHITGYSLGASTATVSLPDWVSLLKSRNDQRKIQAYVYASPRPGNEGFAQYIAELDVPITLYTNRNDIVPHVPPRSMGYVHAAPEIHERYVGLGRTELVECSQEYDEDPNCGYKETFPISVAMHLLPLNGLVPLPPYC
ncbi:alpha/beta-hydrolase [Neoconidiobolus thromboides FSU 785]|nr:alpha/beta-hydrolase [Neoconidiobolus thromboides FSU 785]